jgi:hypothetical protein
MIDIWVDITYVVGAMSQMENPCPQCWIAVKQILQYFERHIWSYATM